MTTLTTTLEVAKLALAHCGITKAITDIDSDLSTEDRMANLFYAPTRDELMELYPWSHAIEHRPLVLTSGYYEFNQVYGYTAPLISGITNANPAVVTTATHGLITGNYGKIYDVSGMTEVNRAIPFHLTKVLATTVQLTGIDSTYWGTYTSGGSIVKMEPMSKYQNGLVYDLPSDYAYTVGLEGDYDYEIKGIEGSLKLLTNADDAVLIYVKADTDDSSLATWRASYVNALVLRLALKLAIPICGVEVGMKLVTHLERMYQIAENEAMLLQARDRKITRDTTDPWITARGGV